MTDKHPITPPSELLQLWFEQYYDYGRGLNELLIDAARYGADQELEACCEVLSGWGVLGTDQLRAARRPKPPSLKQQALEELNLTADPDGAELSRTQVELIRRALEALPE